MCGGGFTIVDAHHYGCATTRLKGICDNRPRIRRVDLGRRGRDGLKRRLLAPDLIEEFARSFQAEVNRLTTEKARHRAERRAAGSRGA
jgi:hypothetical protein